VVDRCPRLRPNSRQTADLRRTLRAEWRDRFPAWQAVSDPKRHDVEGDEMWERDAGRLACGDAWASSGRASETRGDRRNRSGRFLCRSGLAPGPRQAIAALIRRWCRQADCRSRSSRHLQSGPACLQLPARRPVGHGWRRWSGYNRRRLGERIELGIIELGFLRKHGLRSCGRDCRDRLCGYVGSKRRHGRVRCACTGDVKCWPNEHCTHGWYAVCVVPRASPARSCCRSKDARPASEG
jgi:hypothetical protein